MPSKKELLKKAKLYLILDAQVNSAEELIDVTHQALEAGVEVFQLRAKSLPSIEIKKLAIKLKDIIGDRAIFILNDNPKLAKELDVDGVHVGQDDVSLSEARSYMGDGIVGVSCQSLGHAIEADGGGADYIGFGSVFKTKTKPERDPMNLNLLKNVVNTISIPVFPIGGITPENSEKLYDLGLRRYAICRAISEAENIKLSVDKLLKYC